MKSHEEEKHKLSVDRANASMVNLGEFPDQTISQQESI